MAAGQGTPGPAGRLPGIAPLPLTPSKLMELVEEFRHMAATAPTPESGAALRRLAFRYAALARGYDIEQIRSDRVH